jgi:hypothetical protein
VPLETIYPAATRRAVIGRAIEFLSACVPSDLDTTIISPLDGTLTNERPPVSGLSSANAISVQVSVRRVSDTTFYNGTIFTPSAEVWLNALGAISWTYALPALDDGAYTLRARTLAAGPLTDTTPAAITFTLDTLAPAAPTLITPTGGISMVAVVAGFAWLGDSIPNGIWDVDLDGTLHQAFELAPPSGITVPNTATFAVTWPVTDGLHAWRVRANDAAGNGSDWSSVGLFRTSSLRAYLPLVHKNFASKPPTGSCTDVITNGTFETGSLAGWTTPSTNPPAQAINSPVYTGKWAARIGALDAHSVVTGYSSIQQAVTLPVNAITATLSFARYRYSGDASDLQYVTVLNNANVTYLVSEHINDPHWLTSQFDLTPYMGQNITVRFSVFNNGTGGSTGLLVDDIKLMVCTP